MEFNLMAAPKKGGSGRRKIEIEKIANEEALQVCFSKRRRGLFKKAAELSTLCGVDLAAVVFSPGGKAFTFGHPNVGCVLDRYLNPTLLRLAPAPYDPAGEALLGSLMGECEALRQMVDAHSGKKRAGAEEALWWAAPLDGVGLDQLVARKEMTQALRRDVLSRIGELERVERSVHGGE